jgi:signal transduction histidine kinase/ligand-binding sensor domain-containing protein
MHGPSPVLRVRPIARKVRSIVTLVACAVVLIAARAMTNPDPRYAVRNWRVEDGLPDNTVNQIVQDERGFLWLATSGGLARFDGLRFDEYPLPGLSRDASANIRDLAVEPGGSLVLLPAAGGILRLRHGEFSEHPASAALRGRPLLALFPEPGGALWLVPGGSGIMRWENGTVKTFGPAEGFTRGRYKVSFAVDERGRTWIAGADFLGWYDQGALHRWPQNLGPSVSIAPARHGGFWIATEAGLLRMENGATHEVHTGPGWTRATSALQDMYENADGALWFASRRYGISRLSDGAIQPVPASHDQVVALAGDSEGNLWAGTSGAGLDRVRPQPFVLLNDTSGLIDKISSSICEDASGTIWMANRRGGLVRFGPHPQAFTPPKFVGEFFANVVSRAPDGTIWVGAQQGVFRLRPQREPRLEPITPELREVHVMFISRAGDVWIGAGEHEFGAWRDEAFHPLSAADGYTGRRVKAVVEDSAGHLIVATDDRQVFELVNNHLTPLVTRAEMPGGLIASAYCDEDDFLWLATSHGLVLRRKGALHLFTTDEGLPDDMISQILPDDHGRLWFGSRRGLFSVRRSDLLAVADERADRVDTVPLGRDEGLVGASALNTTQPMSWKGHDGRLWFTTFEGVVGVDPTASMPARPAPRVYIDRVEVNHEQVTPNARIRLGPGGGQVIFQFAALNYSAPERVRLRHRLVGYDFDWIETSQDRRAVYNRLPPGEYQIEVTAADAGGAWNPIVARLPVIVEPRWWQTWWARVAFVALFTAAVAAAARYWSVRRIRHRLERLEREHALEKERARIARNLHDELGGSLTQIGMLADRVRRRAAQSEVKTALNQLSWRTRRLADELESIVWTVNPGNDTWDKLAGFIEQYATGFCRDSGVHCTVEGADRIPSLPLAPEAQHNVLSVMKEALNNVLKHAQATKVSLAMDVRDAAFQLRISDNGVGFDPAAPEHAERNGLKNMRARMADVGGEFSIESNRGSGTEIVLRQPLAAPVPHS